MFIVQFVEYFCVSLSLLQLNLHIGGTAVIQAGSPLQKGLIAQLL